MVNSKYRFNGKPIRSAWNPDSSEWFFAIIDVVAAITGQESYSQVRKHWSMIKIRWSKSNESQLTTVCGQLKMRGAYNEMVVDCEF